MANEAFDSLEDLVSSRSFRNWVLLGDTPEAAFWTHWVDRNPGRAELVNQARAVIFALQLRLRPLREGDVHAEVEKVLAKLRDGRLNPVREIPFRPSLLGRRVARGWLIAASLAILAIAAWAFRLYLHPPRENFYRSFLASDPARRMHQQSVDTGTASLIHLPGGSTVRLSRGSKLSWPENPTGHPLSVFLEGEASFSITHSATNPFFVYTRSLVTKALGTAFTVNTAAGAKTIVSVASGKVSVFHTADLTGGVILMPNQQISYDPDKGHFDKSIITSPKPVAPQDSAVLRFESTPVSAVFHRLQDRYGIPILFEEKAVAGCSLSVILGNEPFFEKLDIVCRAIGASYEASDGNIVITANGCR